MIDDVVIPDSSKEEHSILWTISALLLFTILAVAGYKYREAMHNTVILSAPLDQECSLNNGSCTTTLADGGRVTFTLGPHPIVAVSPLQMSLQLEGIAAQGVEVDFRGENMNMGINRFAMQQQSDTRFSGQAILPVCVRNSMAWIADVQVTTAEGKIAIPFRFESIHP